MRLVAFLGLLLLAMLGHAHEVRPAYLELTEERAGEFHVLWKLPMRGDFQLALSPVFSGKVERISPVIARQAGGAAIRTWRIRPIDSLRGQTLTIEGLQGTMTDAMVRIAYLDGTAWQKRLTPSVPSVVIPAVSSAGSVMLEYLMLGVEHILIGIDHLLFVLAIMLLTRGSWNLIKTITAFTLAHSITLGLASLGFVRVPQAPVEAVIALSIVFVAAEVLRMQAGKSGMAARAPWLVAFSFGLLHGFGFAGALSEIGLPEGNIPLALLFFNFGVEIGQLIFIVTVLGLMALTKRVRAPLPAWDGRVVPYLIGSLAMFWVIQRVAAF